VKQAVVRPGSTGIQIRSFHNETGNAPQGQITGQTGAGQSPSDDENGRLQAAFFHPKKFPLQSLVKLRNTNLNPPSILDIKSKLKGYAVALITIKVLDARRSFDKLRINSSDD
jgi:hypothetical protein